MTLIKRFEEIQAWQEARKLTRKVYNLTNRGGFARDFGLRDQIRRASVSIMANIAEGFDCPSPLEFKKFLSYSRRSSVEVQSLLYTALDAGYIDQDEFNDLYSQAEKTKALVGGFMASIDKKLSHT